MERDELAHARWKSRRLLAVVSLSFGAEEKPTARRVETLGPSFHFGLEFVATQIFS